MENKNLPLTVAQQELLAKQEQLFQQQLKDLGPIDNDMAKKLAMMIANKIPYAGGIISGLIGTFWPTTEVSLWDQIKEQVEKMVDQKIAANNLLRLKSQLQGIKNNMRDYNTLTDPGQKLRAIQSIDTVIQSIVPGFTQGPPESAFSVFWGIALLHLSVRRELYDLNRDEANRKLLRNSVMLYCTYARLSLSRAYNNRMNSVSVPYESTNEPGKNSNWIIYVDMNDQGRNLFHFSNRYVGNKWNTGVLDERTTYCNTEIASQWTKLQSELQTEMKHWAFDAILLLEAEYSFTPTEGLAEVKASLDSDQVKIFEEEYYPNASLFNEPVTSRPITRTKGTPTVQLNPWHK